MSHTTKLLVLITSLFVAAVAGYSKRASAQGTSGLFFSPSIMYWSYEDVLTGSKSELTAQYLDVRLGYIMSNSIYLGGLYSSMDREQNTTDYKRTGYGASIGVVYNQFVLIGHYIISSEYEMGSSVKLKEGSGIQVDIGYLFSITGSFFAGPQVSHRNIDYKKVNSTSTNDSSTTETIPYISLAFIF